MSSCIMLQLPSVALSVNEHGPVENVFRIEDGGFSSRLCLPEGKPTFFLGKHITTLALCRSQLK